MTDPDKTTETSSDTAGMGYEQARDELVAVVRELEAGGLSLEQSLALWEKGEALARVCERHLEGARKRIDDKLASVTDNGGDDRDLSGGTQP